MLILKIMAVLFLVPGFGTIFFAKSIVDWLRLDEKTKCDFEAEMSAEEVRDYKRNKAIVNVKMLGMLFALPGVVMIIVVFK